MSALAALAALVGDVGTFSDEHWGRAPLLHRAANPARIAALLRFGDVDRLVTESLLRMPAFRLVKDGKPLPPSSYTHDIRIGGRKVDRVARPDRIAEEFAAGATIALQALHRMWGPVALLCRELEIELTHPVQANAYVTPATSRGFAVHHDTHDVFVLQTEGHKAWRVYRPVVELAGPDQPWKRGMGDPGEPILDVELAPGDCLYLPRGFLHEAEALEEVSIHITVGILTTTWADLWREVVRGASRHRPFREALPIGYARHPEKLAEELPIRAKAMASWLEEEAESRQRSLDAARRFWGHRRPLLSGQLLQVDRLRRAGPHTAWARRPASLFEVSVEGEEATVVLGWKELRMPAHVEADLRFVAVREEPFTAADLPGTLDAESRLVLLRRLVREGALEVVDGG